MLGTATPRLSDYYTCPVNFHVVQRGLMGGDICRMCPARSIADGNGAECWACKHGEWRAVMHCDNFSAGRIMRMNAADRGSNSRIFAAGCTSALGAGG